MMTLARLATARHCASTACAARLPAHRAGTAAAIPARSVRASASRWRPGDGTEDEEAREKPATEALIDAMDSAAKLRNRDSGGKVTTVMGSDAGAGGLGANMTWKELDERVNEYPSDRKFQAIGEGGDAFVAEIVRLVEGALGRPVDPARVTSRPSKKGKYVSANVTARLQNGDEVVAVYAALKACEKVVWYL
jgi:putative lipoic acid-binding regulatory protein